jgi:hypothetical protein
MDRGANPGHDPGRPGALRISDREERRHYGCSCKDEGEGAGRGALPFRVPLADPGYSVTLSLPFIPIIAWGSHWKL